MSDKIELRGIVTDALIGMISAVVEMSPPEGAPIPPFIQSAIDRAVERIASALAQQPTQAAPAPEPEPEPQEPVAFYWQDLDAFPLTERRHGPYFGWPSEDAIARCQHYAKPIPLYAAPPTDEQPYSATSDRYRAELYGEVWSQARLIGFGNVTDALAELQRMKLAEQPDAVKVPRELLRELADIADSMQCFDARDDAMGLLDKGGE